VRRAEEAAAAGGGGGAGSGVEGLPAALQGATRSRELMQAMWAGRLRGVQRNVEVWQALLRWAAAAAAAAAAAWHAPLAAAQPLRQPPPPARAPPHSVLPRLFRPPFQCAAPDAGDARGLRHLAQVCQPVPQERAHEPERGHPGAPAGLRARRRRGPRPGQPVPRQPGAGRDVRVAEARVGHGGAAGGVRRRAAAGERADQRGGGAGGGRRRLLRAWHALGGGRRGWNGCPGWRAGRVPGQCGRPGARAAACAGAPAAGAVAPRSDRGTDRGCHRRHHGQPARRHRVRPRLGQGLAPLGLLQLRGHGVLRRGRPSRGAALCGARGHRLLPLHRAGPGGGWAGETGGACVGGVALGCISSEGCQSGQGWAGQWGWGLWAALPSGGRAAGCSWRQPLLAAWLQASPSPTHARSALNTPPPPTTPPPPQ
jgi:hypothetical protein